MSKKTALSIFVSALLLVSTLAAGAAHAQSPAKPELKVGFVPGPYIDGFKAGVAPELQKKGYRIRYIEFSTGLEVQTGLQLVQDVLGLLQLMIDHFDSPGVVLGPVKSLASDGHGLERSIKEHED